MKRRPSGAPLSFFVKKRFLQKQLIYFIRMAYRYKSITQNWIFKEMRSTMILKNYLESNQKWICIFFQNIIRLTLETSVKWMILYFFLEFYTTYPMQHNQLMPSFFVFSWLFLKNYTVNRFCLLFYIFDPVFKKAFLPI